MECWFRFRTVWEEVEGREWEGDKEGGNEGVYVTGKKLI